MTRMEGEGWLGIRQEQAEHWPCLSMCHMAFTLQSKDITQVVHHLLNEGYRLALLSSHVTTVT